MDDDWDLHAVVRGCTAALTTTTTTTATTAAATTAAATNDDDPFLSFSSNDDQFDFPDFDGLREVYQQFCGDDPPPPTADTAAADTNSVPAAPHFFHPHQEIVQIKPSPMLNTQIQQHNTIQFNNNPPRLGSSSSSLNFPAANPQPIRPRRRKNNQMKMIREMTQEELSADSWAWRKYGQKPIKGSPYPRNYYRCSTSKGCAARKQVERSPNDAAIFVVSYSGEHTHPRPTHRSSLAGSTRNKFSSSSSKNSHNTTKPLLLQPKPGSISSSSPASGPSFSPHTPLVDGETVPANDVEMTEEDGVLMNIADDLINDDEDLFKAFHDSDDHSSGGGDLFSSSLLSSPPWTPTSSAADATAGGGG